MNLNPLKYFIDDHARLLKTLKKDRFYQQRESAFKLFQQTGLPTTRQEDWKYTDVRSITEKPFVTNNKSIHINDDEIDEIRLTEPDCIELVFINGVFSKEHSNIRELPDAVIVCDLFEALRNQQYLLNKYVTRIADNNANPFIALNTAFIQNGTFIYIPQNTVVEKPISLVYLMKDQCTPFASYPRNLIIMEQQTEATLVENYIGLDDASYFTNTVTEISLADGARLKRYKIQQESQNSHHMASLNIMQHKNSYIESHLVSLGGSLVRDDIHSQLAAEGAEIILNGLYMANGKQHIDNHTYVNHIKPNTLSTENYRGVLNDQSRAVFNGKIIVHKNAQKVEAHQNNANLLLSDTAEIDTKPELQIYADDVKCSHGTTVGQLDKTMLFYLRSRAIDKVTAKTLLTFAFVEEIINKIKLASIRNRLKHFVLDQLPDTSLISDFANE